MLNERSVRCLQIDGLQELVIKLTLKKQMLNFPLAPSPCRLDLGGSPAQPPSKLAAAFMGQNREWGRAHLSCMEVRDDGLACFRLVMHEAVMC